jgi:L-malate glycosyltransferase
MNILIATIQKMDASGGVNTYINQLHKGLSERGHNVNIISADYISKLPKDIMDKLRLYEKLYYDKLGKSILKYHISNEVGILAFKEVVKNIDVSNVDVVHSQDGISSMIFKEIHPDLPLVGTIHGCFYTEYLHMGLFKNEMEKKLTARYDKWAVESPDEIITVSSFVDSNIPEIPDIKRNVVNNGIEIDKYRNNVSSKKNKFIRIITSGSLLYYKGYDVLMKSLAIVKEKSFDFEVYMFGDGDKKGEIEELVNQYNLPVNIKGKVTREELANELHKGDIFIQPSRVENFPYSVVEAMASGCAVICSRVGGMTDQIDHKINGLLFESEDHVDLAKQIIFLIENKTLSKLFGEESSNRAKTFFTTNKMLDATEEVYSKALYTKRVLI